jgi:hypothetical protein
MTVNVSGDDRLAFLQRDRAPVVRDRVIGCVASLRLVLSSLEAGSGRDSVIWLG